MSEQATKPNPSPTADVGDASGAAHAEALSAWVDGELSEQAQQPLWMQCEQSAQPALQTWHRYHLIGDVLRATAETPFACTDAALSAEKSRAAAQHIMALAQVGQVAPATPVAPMGDVVGVGHVVVVPVAQRAEAANDGVFRWKMVSGFASVVAVVSLAWSLGVSPTGQANGPVLAQSAPAIGSNLVADAVLVSTPHGTVLRDARLEELMLAHRQTGGASALQVPAGFLRNATFDATQR